MILGSVPKPCVATCGLPGILKRTSISEAKEDTDERRDICDVIVPRFWRLTLDVRTVLLSRVGDRTESPGVFGRRIAEAGNAGGPMMVVAWLDWLLSRVGDATLLLALAITSR